MKSREVNKSTIFYKEGKTMADKYSELGREIYANIGGPNNVKSMYLWGSTFLDWKLTGIVRMMVLMKDGKMTIAM